MVRDLGPAVLAQTDTALSVNMDLTFADSASGNMRMTLASRSWTKHLVDNVK